MEVSRAVRRLRPPTVGDRDDLAASMKVSGAVDRPRLINQPERRIKTPSNEWCTTVEKIGWIELTASAPSAPKGMFPEQFAESLPSDSSSGSDISGRWDTKGSGSTRT